VGVLCVTRCSDRLNDAFPAILCSVMNYPTVIWNLAQALPVPIPLAEACAVSAWNCIGVLQPSSAHRNDILSQSLSAWGELWPCGTMRKPACGDTRLHSGHATYNQLLSVGHASGCEADCYVADVLTVPGSTAATRYLRHCPVSELCPKTVGESG
jgi:hypothetical protein